ncbi:MAG TPA: hypothetical protein QF901_02470 [Gammaproteobacteria bacterium]|nr:hypothetical protein [Gammaproteobacteria bacterium]
MSSPAHLLVIVPNQHDVVADFSLFGNDYFSGVVQTLIALRQLRFRLDRIETW